MKKIICNLVLIMITFYVIFATTVYAGDITDPKSVIDSMDGVKADQMAGTNNSFGDIINTVIGLLQVAGTGISIIVVSILGIKYLIASPSEKADTKKSIMPIVIGCVLLFGAVNIMAAVSDFAEKAFS